MSRILVTGGCGYIGAHSIVDLVQKGYEVLCVDDLSRSNGSLLKGIKQITGKEIDFVKIDLSDKEAVVELFEKEKNIDGIIHFAAYRLVGESVQFPLLYFRNNIDSLIYLLEGAEKNGVKNFIFSSSCSVYGNIDKMPVTENTPLNEAESPYGRSKQICELMIKDTSKASKMNFMILRYFNPVGAHESALIGEIPFGKPSNLVPAITQTAMGVLPEFVINGKDYPTRDGTCIRDYIHVMDIAEAHTLALNYFEKVKQKSNCEVFNLGSGTGVSVKEMVDVFEKVSDRKLNYRYGPRRDGDVVTVYADRTLAEKQLGWKPKYSIDDMMQTAWKWEQYYRNKTPNP
jgi:UDP-glucose 4-epimerase